MSDDVLVAVISGAVALLIAMLELVRRQNSRQHAQGRTLLESIDDRTSRMDEKLDRHGEQLGAHGERITALEVHHEHDASWSHPSRNDIARRRAHRQGGDPPP